MMHECNMFSPKEVLIKNNGFKEPYWNINMAHEPDKQIDFSNWYGMSYLYNMSNII